MAYKINFFGWCSQDGHDKVWGYVTMGEHLYNFWGRRGKKFSFQQSPETWGSAHQLELKAKAKCRQGRSNGTYSEVAVADIETVVPGFYLEFEHQLTMAKLFNKFHGDRPEE